MSFVGFIRLMCGSQSIRFYRYPVIPSCYSYGTVYANNKYAYYSPYTKRRSYSMKKILMVVFAVIIGLALVTVSFAQTTAPTDTKAATGAAKEKATEKAKAAGEATKEKATKAATEKMAPEKAAPEKAAAPAPEKKAEKKATKEKVHQYTGEVTTMDAAAKTLTIKGKKGEKTFDVTDAKMKAEPKAGDKVMVKYTEKDGKMTAKSVAAAKAAKKAPKKAEKPAEKPAEAAPPAK